MDERRKITKKLSKVSRFRGREQNWVPSHIGPCQKRYFLSQLDLYTAVETNK
jgi:hypothetical protein